MPAYGIDYETKSSGPAGTVETATATLNLSGINARRGMTILFSESIPPPVIMGVV